MWKVQLELLARDWLGPHLAIAATWGGEPQMEDLTLSLSLCLALFINLCDPDFQISKQFFFKKNQYGGFCKWAW